MGKRDKQILVGLLAAALILIAVFFVMRQLSGPEARALISIDGEAVQEINLNTAPTSRLTFRNTASTWCWRFRITASIFYPPTALTTSALDLAGWTANCRAPSACPTG